MKKTLSTVVLAFLMFSAAAHAQSPSGETSSDEPTFVEPTPQLRWSLGLGVISSPRPYIGVDNKITPIPLIELTYKKWYVQGIQAGYHFIDNRKFTLDARAGFVFAGLDPEDSAELAGMNKKDSSVDAGFVFDWKPGKYRLSTSISTDILGVSNGQQAAMDFSRILDVQPRSVRHRTVRRRRVAEQQHGGLLRRCDTGRGAARAPGIHRPLGHQLQNLPFRVLLFHAPHPADRVASSATARQRDLRKPDRGSTAAGSSHSLV